MRSSLQRWSRWLGTAAKQDGRPAASSRNAKRATAALSQTTAGAPRHRSFSGGSSHTAGVLPKQAGDGIPAASRHSTTHPAGRNRRSSAGSPAGLQRAAGIASTSHFRVRAKRITPASLRRWLSASSYRSR